MKKRTWWEHEWLNEQQKQETIEWLKNETKIKEIADKEKIIIEAYRIEIEKIKIEIKKLEKEIERKEKECSKCLARIQDGDSGLMAIIGERNTNESTQIQENIEQKSSSMVNGQKISQELHIVENGQMKK